MSGRSRAILRRAIQTGSSSARAAFTRLGPGRRWAIISVATPALIAVVALAAAYSWSYQQSHDDDGADITASIPARWPFEVAGAQYLPVGWADLPNWADDDHAIALKTFRASCKAILASSKPSGDSKALTGSLALPCERAKHLSTSEATARAFFEREFAPLQITKLGDSDGFVTGYYEPVLDGSRVKTDVYNIPIYRRPSNLFVRGYKQDAELPNKGAVYRKIGRRKLVPYYDRGEIEDGAIAGRGLEICWLKSQTDLLFTQIQGSARIKLQDGSTMRINYDAHNGYPYTPVGRVLIESNIIPKDQMSMRRIREWMDQNPDGAKELRRQNRSYVFFRRVNLSDKDEAEGAQGVQLTAGRSIAVDKSLHVYGTPFYIAGDLPLVSEQSKTPFRRLMVAQDTGSAIVGPARADLYFGAGDEAGKISGRLKNNATFYMLVPKHLDPSASARTMPRPRARPSDKIARLFPELNKPTDDKAAAPAALATEASKPASASSAVKQAEAGTSSPKKRDSRSNRKDRRKDSR